MRKKPLTLLPLMVTRSNLRWPQLVLDDCLSHWKVKNDSPKFNPINLIRLYKVVERKRGEGEGPMTPPPLDTLLATAFNGISPAPTSEFFSQVIWAPSAFERVFQTLDGIFNTPGFSVTFPFFASGHRWCNRRLCRERGRKAKFKHKGLWGGPKTLVLQARQRRIFYQRTCVFLFHPMTAGKINVTDQRSFHSVDKKKKKIAHWMIFINQR